MHQQPLPLTRSLALAAGVTLAAVSGCTADAMMSGSSAPRSSLASADRGHSPEEDHLFRLAAAVPSFAGAYYDSEGNFVVLVTDTVAAGQGRGVFEREHRNHTGSDRGHVVLRPAKYRFLELAAWRDTAVGAFAEEPWIVSVDLDEAENRIEIGVDKAAARVSKGRQCSA